MLNVFEQIHSWTIEGDYRDSLVRHLRRDGYDVDESGRIRGGSAATLADIPLEQLSDPSSIYEHLERIAASTDSDPGVAISGARALIEATTKLVLAELGEAYDEKADVPALVKAAQKALALHPDSLAPTRPGVEITKRILSNLSQLAIGVAELRNQYGPDHGRTTAVVGLRPRHAHLAVGAATTYCRMLLETLAARTSA
ncbi:MAG: abortive infection family protein [Acidimicrobiia bacterium]|nr:abortive infection family protein [Acidimicrobiia bacterium]